MIFYSKVFFTNQSHGLYGHDMTQIAVFIISCMGPGSDF